LAPPTLPRLSYEDAMALSRLTGPVDITGLAPVQARAPPRPYGGGDDEVRAQNARTRAAATTITHSQSLSSRPIESSLSLARRLLLSLVPSPALSSSSQERRARARASRGSPSQLSTVKEQDAPPNRGPMPGARP
jgi:hypothetical protein